MSFFFFNGAINVGDKQSLNPPHLLKAFSGLCQLRVLALSQVKATTGTYLGDYTHPNRSLCLVLTYRCPLHRNIKFMNETASGPFVSP